MHILVTLGSKILKLVPVTFSLHVIASLSDIRVHINVNPRDIRVHIKANISDIRQHINANPTDIWLHVFYQMFFCIVSHLWV